MVLKLQEVELLLDGIQAQRHIVVGLGETEDHLFQPICDFRTRIMLLIEAPP